ncbi:hypothetical protein BDW69DRAFT_183935 [Aspergillus filifer]
MAPLSASSGGMASGSSRDIATSGSTASSASTSSTTTSMAVLVAWRSHFVSRAHTHALFGSSLSQIPSMPHRSFTLQLCNNQRTTTRPPVEGKEHALIAEAWSGQSDSGVRVRVAVVDTGGRMQTIPGAGRANQWASLKIMTANRSQHLRELDILHLLASQAEVNLASNHIDQLIDEFTHEGPNETHLCLVFELLGPSFDKIVANYHEVGDRLEPEVILRISRQVLEGIKFPHDAGLGHGDISGGNLAFGCSALTNADEGEILRVLGQPEIEDMIRLDGKPLAPGIPSQMVKATDWAE